MVAQTRAVERGGLTKAEAQVTDDPDIVTSHHGNALRPGLVTETELQLHSSLDLAGIADLVLDATVPDFADAGAVFVLSTRSMLVKSAGPAAAMSWHADSEPGSRSSASP